MRYILAFSLLITLHASASAANTSHVRRQHAVDRARQGVTADTVPGFAYAPPVRYPARPEPSPYDNRYPNWGGM